MIDTDFIKRFLSYDSSIPFIESGETLPLELVEWLQQNSDKVNNRDLTHLFLPSNKEKRLINITLRCPECGDVFVYTSSIGKLEYDIDNMIQNLHSPNNNRVQHTGPRLCPVCQERYLKEQDEIIRREFEERQRKKKEKEEERKRKEQEQAAIFERYFERAPEGFSPTVEDYLELEDKAHHGGFLMKLCSMPEDAVYNSLYWNIIAAEKIRRAKEPKCVLSGRANNLTILINREILGWECLNDMKENPIISKDLLEKFGTSRLWNSISKTDFGDSNNRSISNGFMRTYKADEILPFGKHKGELILDVLLTDRPYFVFLHDENHAFNVVDADGKPLF